MASNIAGRMFRDRQDAAEQLAEKLKSLALRDPLVLGIPRGGAVTAAVLARELNAEMDVVLARKLGHPLQPELAVGAVSEDGSVVLNPDAAADVSNEELEAAKRRSLAELKRRRDMFRAIRPPASMAGRSVIVTDDGVATGSTMFAALDAVKAQKPHELIVAVPVAPPSTVEELQARCDQVVCLSAPEMFVSIGQFYEDFAPVEDEEVCATLRDFAPATRHG